MARRRRRQQANIRAILEMYGERAAEAARQSIRDNAETLAEEARSRCPVETGFYRGRQFRLNHPGRLRDSIHVEQRGHDTMLVVADAKDDSGFCYAPIVEYAPYGTPFMIPAYETKKDEMINHTKDLIRAAIVQ